MRRPWLVYLLTALAACAAGVAIAGLPSGGTDEALLPPPPTATAGSTTTSAAPTTTEPAPTTTAAVETTTTSTVADTTTSTSAVVTTTSTVAPTSTEAPATTTAEPTDVPLGELRVAVANGAGVPGLAGSAADVLQDAGFSDVVAVNTGPASASTVFRREGLDAAVALIVAELALPGAVADVESAPAIDVTGDYDIVVVLGADRIP